MLHELGLFLSWHPIAGAFIIFLIFVVIQKLDKLFDHWIDSESDVVVLRRQERERMARIRANLD